MRQQILTEVDDQKATMSYDDSVIFSKKNAGKWVASKGEKVIATGSKLEPLVKKIEKRKDKDAIRFDLVPPHSHFAGALGIPVR